MIRFCKEFTENRSLRAGVAAEASTVRADDFFRLAAPSWVMPGTIRDNCCFLANKVDEVGLLFMETESSLAYGDEDLPPELATLPLAFHVHLPVDLPWEQGGAAVGSICLALMDKVNFIQARRAVLHPPVLGSNSRWEGCGRALEEFSRVWRQAGRGTEDVLLENIAGNDLTGLAGCFGRGGFGLCPDLGHILAHGQWGTLSMLRGLPETARPGMLHCSAPGSGLPGEAPKSAHCPLDGLDAAGMAAGETLCSLLAEHGVIMAELFDWSYIERSLPVIREWRAMRNVDGAGEN
jgi:hypothetical protein